MKSKLSALVLSAAAISLLAACGSPEGSATPTPTETEKAFDMSEVQAAVEANADRSFAIEWIEGEDPALTVDRWIDSLEDCVNNGTEIVDQFIQTPQDQLEFALNVGSDEGIPAALGATESDAQCQEDLFAATDGTDTEWFNSLKNLHALVLTNSASTGPEDNALVHFEAKDRSIVLDGSGTPSGTAYWTINDPKGELRSDIRLTLGNVDGQVKYTGIGPLLPDTQE